MPRCVLADRLWIAAGAATVVAVGVAGYAWFGGGVSGDVHLDDAREDVVGTAPASIAAALDLAGARVRRDRGGYRVTFELHRKLERPALEAEPAKYELAMQGRTNSYTLQAFVGSRRVEARIVAATGSGTAPYVTSVPKVGARSIEVRFPGKAVKGLGDRFSWGVAARAAGSEDTAPADRSARFPS